MPSLSHRPSHRARPATLAAALLALLTLAGGCSNDQEVGSGGECELPPDEQPCSLDIHCDNTPNTICGAEGVCVCNPDPDPDPDCNLPPDGLACSADGDCGNYPPATCGAEGVCVCN